MASETTSLVSLLRQLEVEAVDYETSGGCSTEKLDQMEKRILKIHYDMLAGLMRAEQTVRNLAQAFLAGDAQVIASNEAANLRADIARAKAACEVKSAE
jgi:hypothetical protein